MSINHPSYDPNTGDAGRNDKWAEYCSGCGRDAISLRVPQHFVETGYLEWAKSDHKIFLCRSCAKEENLLNECGFDDDDED